jgi:hypothetical protein
MSIFISNHEIVNSAHRHLCGDLLLSRMLLSSLVHPWALKDDPGRPYLTGELGLGLVVTDKRHKPQGAS